jgi:hypothetical protein
MNSKRCTRCGHELPLELFWQRTDRPGRYKSACKPCCYAREREIYRSLNGRDRRSNSCRPGRPKAEQAANEAFKSWRGAEPGHIFARAW